MVRCNLSMVSEVKTALKEGVGDVGITHIYQNSELKSTCRLCAKMSLEPGASIGNHIHEHEEEIYYILKGKGLVVDDGVPKEVFEGDAVLTRDGAAHSIENIGDTVLELIAIINTY